MIPPVVDADHVSNALVLRDVSCSALDLHPCSTISIEASHQKKRPLVMRDAAEGRRGAAYVFRNTDWLLTLRVNAHLSRQNTLILCAKYQLYIRGCFWAVMHLFLGQPSRDSEVARLPEKSIGIATRKFGECGGENPQCGVRLGIHNCLSPFQALTCLHIERVNEIGGNSCC